MKSVSEAIRPAGYQLVPLAKVLANGLNAVLICDGVGVGKTISAGYIIAYFRSKTRKPAIVVCSPTLISKWAFELKSKFGILALPVRSMDDLETAKDETIHRPVTSEQPTYIISNSLISQADVKDYPPSSATIFDEIHTYRNPDAEWHEGCLRLAKNSDVRVGLTATPINNRLEDIVAELSILLANFDSEVVDAVIQDLWNSNRRALVGALVTRFLKDKLGIHFAKRDIESVMVTYPESYIHEVLKATKEHTAGQGILELITYYRLAASSPWAFWSALGRKDLREKWPDSKLDSVNRIISDRTNGISHWLIFCEFKQTAEFLSRKLNYDNVYTMTGETPMFDRPSIVQSFRTAPRALLVVTSVGSEGLDFQFCGGLVNYDLHWNPMKLEQRAGRIDRVGQKRKMIRIVNIRVANSIDDRVISVMRQKLDLISGSVFAVDPLLSSHDRKIAGPTIYTEETLAHELNVSSSLVETFRFNDKIEVEDYRGLSSIDTTFCQPSNLMNTPPLHPSDIVREREWSKSTSENARAVLGLLTHYSQGIAS